LLRERLLLLHGRSQCGKTTTARSLLARIRDKGWTIETGQDVREASRILCSVGSDEIVYFLDDPIRSSAINSADIWDNLQHLVSSIPPHRYLIITSRTDDLYSLLGASEQHWSLAHQSWLNLTVTDRDFLRVIWQKISSKLSRNVVKMIEQHIMQEPIDSLLQPGQLSFLAQKSNDELIEMNQSMLLSTARSNSRALASTLTKKGTSYRDVLRALSMVATHIEYVLEEDFLYILSGLNEAEYPSKNARKEHYYEDRESYDYSFPRYQEKYVLQDTQIEVLDALERQGLIQRNEHYIRFIHPDYSEAAIITREIQTQRDREAVHDFFLRAIFCVNTNAAITAARSIGIEIQKCLSQKQSYQYLFRIALQGLESLYPAVIDVCLEILISRIDELNQDEKELVWKQLDFYYADHQFIDWHDGQPWIAPKKEDDRQRVTYRLANWFLDTKMNLSLDNNTTPPSEKDTSSFAIWYRLSSHPYVLNTILKALEKPESFIRRKAIFQLLASDFGIDFTILDRVLDDHPIVAGTAIWTLIKERSSAEILIACKARLMQVAGRTGVAVVLHRKFFRAGSELEDYPAIEAKAETILAILQSVLEGLPMSDYYTDDTHLDYTLEAFTKVLTKERYIEVTYLRINYLMHQLKFRLPDCYGLCVGDFLLKYVPKEEPNRQILLQRLLHHPETAVAVSTVAHCIERWESLTANEQRLCLEALVMERDDRIWLKAVALTRYHEIPVEVLVHINLPENFASLSAANAVEALSSELLSACIRIYCGIPQPLWYIGLHHAGESKWRPIVEFIATLPEHNEFEYCIERCLDWACSDEWLEGKVAWRILLEKADPKLRENLVEKLFKCTVNYNCAQVGDYWYQVFEVCKDQEYTTIISKIVGHIDVVQCFNSELKQLTCLFGEKQVLDDIIPRFPLDHLMLNIWLLAKENVCPVEYSLELILVIYNTRPPRLMFVHELMQDLVKGIAPEIFSVIEKARKVTQSQVFAAHDAYRASITDEKIQNWHFCERVSAL